jgi:hypothetical protein
MSKRWLLGLLAGLLLYLGLSLWFGLSSLTASLAARFPAARRKHPARKRRAEAELGPELERAVHLEDNPLHESGGEDGAHGGIDNHSQVIFLQRSPQIRPFHEVSK